MDLRQLRYFVTLSETLNFRNAAVAARWLALAVAVLLLPVHAAAQLQPVNLRLGSGPDVTLTPILYGLKNGTYRRYGINLEIVRMNNGAQVMAALAGGSLDVGKGTPFGVLTAISKGVPLTIIGNLASWNGNKPDVALVVMKNSPVKTAKDLEGRTLGAPSLEDMSAFSTLLWLEQQGADKAAVKYVEIPPAALLAAMEQERIAGASLYEPFFSAALATGKVRILGYPYNAVGRRFPEAVLFADPRWASDHRDVVQRFLQASQEASLYVGAHESETAPLIGEFGGLDPGIPIRTPGRNIVLDPADLQRVLDMLYKVKQIPNPLLAKDLICDCALRAR